MKICPIYNLGIPLLVLTITFHRLPLHCQSTSPAFDSIWAQQFIDALGTTNVQGASVAITWPGEGTFIGVIGESTKGVPITPDMLFGIGSNTKLFTSVLALRLQELGYFSLDDQISEWLPDYNNVDESATIRQCLAHQSGTFDFSNDIDWRDSAIVYGPDTFFTTEMIIARLGLPHFDPGTAYAYSNTGYWLTGLVMQSATGKSYTELLHEHILDPLSLDSTFVAAYEEPTGTLANGWYFGEDLGPYPLVSVYSLYGPAGSIFSTASEMVQWYTHLFEGDIINDASMNELLNFESSSFYGLGIETVIHPFLPDEVIYAHRGEVPGYSSQMGWDVRRRSALCILTNQFDDSNSSFNVLAPAIEVLYSNYPLYKHDAGIQSVNDLQFNLCSAGINPVINLRNFGSKQLFSAVIEYKIDDEPSQTYNWSGDLDPLDSFFVFLPEIPVNAGYHVFHASVQNPNGVVDSGYWNNSYEVPFFNKSGTSAYKRIDQNFEGDLFPPKDWFNGNNSKFNWGQTKLLLPDHFKSAVKSNWFDFTLREYDLELPKIDFDGISHPILAYDWAYGFVPGYDDALEISISMDCGMNYSTIYFAAGEELMTAEVSDLFFPNHLQWKHNLIDLSDYVHHEVWIKFKAISNYGNNLFIDNIVVENYTVNTNAPDNALQIPLKPNPASGYVHIETNLDDCLIRIWDPLGHLWFSDPLSENNIIDITSLNPGIYFVQVLSGGYSNVQSLSIVR